tara:strand:+ start:93 stop:221 length:129 start_codon:yes stop_codon:yes gene_type:complete
MIKKEWHWLLDINKKIGVQGSDYYKPINTKKTTQTTKTNNNG